MTSTFRLFFFLCIALPLVPAARADVAAVHRDKLPQSITTLGAYDDLIQIEHCVDRYSETWQCNLDRQKVVDRLFEDFEFLVSSLRVNPDNRELRLLTLLAAHYAYNVDIDMSYEGFKSAYQPLSQAHDDDIRPRWFLADFQCQANDIEEGMNGFLNMEKSLPANALPARFWHDYTSCATMTVMPAHALHAIDNWQTLQPARDPQREEYRNIAVSRFVAYLPQSKYDVGEIWSMEKRTDATFMTASVCGVKAVLKLDWEIQHTAFDSGTCSLTVVPGRLGGSRQPTMIVTARRQRQGETLEVFEQAFLGNRAASAKKVPAEFCPAKACDEFTLASSDGSARSHYLFFSRPQPQYPGLALELPRQAQQANDQNNSDGTYFHPRGTLRRLSGTIYYMVVLDAATSVEPQADGDYVYLLQHLAVD